MKRLDLNVYDVQEMNVVEMQNVDGGICWIIPFLAGAIVSGIVYELVNNADKCWEAFNDGRETAREKL
jgi:hypothetical protein